MSETTLQENKIKKVLIVEDEGDMCLLLELMLNGKENLQLEHVKRLKDAELLLEQEQPAVVILDNKLPDGFGVDFISYIKKNYPSIRIVMISGFDASAEDVALENGADIFLRKPFTKNQLFEALMKLIG